MNPTLQAALALFFSVAIGRSATLEDLALKTRATENEAPAWIRHGACVYRLCTAEAVKTQTGGGD